MQTVTLGRTGEKVSQLSLGCMLMGTRTSEADSTEMLDRYLAAGGTFLDTANCYCWWHDRGSYGGHSEELLGRWFARSGRRDEVFLATKGSAIPRDVDAVFSSDGEPDWAEAYRTFEGAGAETIRRHVDDSLRRLGTDRIDLYYVHVDDRATPLVETLAALAEMVQAGKVRYLGYSNVRAWRLAEIRRLCAEHGWPAPVAVQQQHSYLRPRAGLDHAGIANSEHLDLLRTYEDMSLVAYSPILMGIYNDPVKRESHGKFIDYRGPDADIRLAVLSELAAELSVTPNQLVLAWLMQQRSPQVIPIIGPRTLDQYQAALPALEIKLTEEQLVRLDAAGA
ncbi:aldo/keto reductase [Natronosporangium hydrolyticum]|uniref:Aldo/keto reductase n=1 Tax=Natronosporangium hydrolyticum TaxID=2811111 RepID=A0A895Y5W2_9ACTN|nr:aldo/keto reductase [Natronosporangium hydrolyticum]QSB13117.1 aldo/keto reductase [Natronosporangium hydrolyticum]